MNLQSKGIKDKIIKIKNKGTLVKLESFTKKIYKSSLISSLWVNVLTLLIVFFVSYNLIFQVYNSQYEKGNNILSEYINDISFSEQHNRAFEKFANGKSNLTIEEVFIANTKTSKYRGIKDYFVKNDFVPEDTFDEFELSIYNKLPNKTDLERHVEIVGEEIYIIDITTYNEYRKIQFFNLTKCRTLQDRFLNEGMLGYSYKGTYVELNSKDDIKEKSNNFLHKIIPTKEIIIDSKIKIPGFKYHFYGTNQLIDNITLFLTIFLISILRIIVTLVNSRANIRKISKPLMDLVKNTEKLASHEAKEKLNRFDYPYMEFKKLAEAFNKVLLSRDLSEIKLFRSFEQMESVVHKRTQELLATNEQLSNAIKKAKEANEAKSQFLANISHEIRTPLNCIIGFCDIILTDTDNDVIRNQIGQILHESETLLHLINDFLDYSKIEAGKMNIIDTDVNIRSLISSLVKSGQIQAGDKTIRLEVEIDNSVPPFIKSDELRLYQVISNIFYNAIKFTEIGSVKIEVSNLITEKIGKSILEIKVIDTGIGIPEDRIDSIFNKFEQVDGSLTRNYRGSGLGLTICKKIVELMKGKIEVESSVGVGSKFTISIPVETQHVSIEPLEFKPQTTEVSNEHVQGSEILLVEDYPVNQIVAKKHLEMDKHNVIIAENGYEAVLQCKANSFDLILMDLQMPVMDGFKATKEIRKLINHKSTPILAMTANAMDTAKQTCMDTGMNGVITKPIRKKVFLKEVNKWLNIRVKEEVTLP